MRINGYEVTVNTEALAITGLFLAAYLLSVGVGRLTLYLGTWEYDGASVPYSAYEYAWIAIVGATHLIIGLFALVGVAFGLSLLLDVEEVSDGVQ